MNLRNRIRAASIIAVAAMVSAALIAGQASASTLIGPGADITDATAKDTSGGERLNVDRTTFVTLEAGSYSVTDWRLNVQVHTEGGTITPMLLSGAPSSYTTVWLGAAFDPTANGEQTVPETGAFTLAAPTDIYAGFFTAGTGSGIIALDDNNSGSGNSSTDHDNGFTAPTGIGETVDGISHPNLGRTYAFEVNVNFDAAPSLLTLQVDTLTGMATMVGDPIDDLDLNFYEITSAGNSLDPAGWNSIEDQDDVGGGFPAASAPGAGDGWEESGSVGTHALAEGFLLGSSTLSAGESIDLGVIYDGGDQDWEFSYRTADGSVEVGVVDFVTSEFDPADLNQDGFVDGLDLGIQLINWGEDVTPDQGELNGAPPVNGLDLGLLLIAWNPKPLSAAAVPEPASFTLVLASLCLVMSRRRTAAP